MTGKRAPVYYKGQFFKGKSSKKMSKSAKKNKKSKMKKASEKRGYSTYPGYYKGTRPTYKGIPSRKGLKSQRKGGLSFGSSFYKGKGQSTKSLGRGGKGKTQKSELPNHYFFYGGNGKGNRGIDVFVFGL